MDADPPPYPDTPAPSARPAAGEVSSPGLAGNDERRTELLLDAVKTAIGTPGEHRLFRSGKLVGLFPTRAGTSAEAALLAVREGLFETVRTEVKGKVVTEWVTATPKGVAFVHEHDSPKSVLRELKEVLRATRDGVPVWMDEARREVAELSARFEGRAAAVLKQLDDLAGRVEAALRRAEAKAPAVADPVGRLVPWAVDALEYLDRRKTGGGGGDCPLPELFHAVRVRSPELSLSAYQDGLRRLHDVRAVQLVPSALMAEPEYAVVVEGKLMYAVGR
ncbi:MAG: hypothetical protein JWO38_6312 [Gemmataceae bacterium]|nr:hypothetical protein [Gemmataceae bacterium]